MSLQGPLGSVEQTNAAVFIQVVFVSLSQLSHKISVSAVLWCFISEAQCNYRETAYRDWDCHIYFLAKKLWTVNSSLKITLKVKQEWW